MGLDCSMMLRCDYHENGNKEEKIEYMHNLYEKLCRKHGIVNGKYSSEDIDYYSFSEIYDIIGINVYDGFCEIETACDYFTYVEDKGLRRFFYEIMEDFGEEEAYVCSEHCGWNGPDLEEVSFEEWKSMVEERYGPIQDFDLKKRYRGNYSEVFRDCFDDMRQEELKFQKEVEAIGCTPMGLFWVGYFIRIVLKDGKRYAYDTRKKELFLNEPIDGFNNFEGFAFRLQVNGTEILYSTNGIELRRGKINQFDWRWPRTEREECYYAEIIDKKTKNSIYVKFCRHQVKKPCKKVVNYITYIDKEGHKLVPEYRI